jgi:hypothetical protein
MAIPINYDPSQNLYMLKISQGSQFGGTGRDLDDFTREIKYKFSKDVRREIGAIRQSINTKRAGSCTRFFGAYFTNEIGKTQLIEACKKADREMKEIDPALHVTPVFIKIDLPDLASGSQFDALLKAIKTQVMEVSLKRVQAYLERNETGVLSPKSKNILISMLEKTRALNIVNDAKINADIDSMKARIEASQLKELREEITEYLDQSQDRGTSIEIISDVSADDDEKEDQISRSASILPNSDRELDLV